MSSPHRDTRGPARCPAVPTPESIRALGTSQLESQLEQVIHTTLHAGGRGALELPFTPQVSNPMRGPEGPWSCPAVVLGARKRAWS